MRHYGVAQSMLSHDGSADDIAYHLGAAAAIVAELGPIVRVPSDVRDQALTALEAKVARAVDQGNLLATARSAQQAIDLFPDPPSAELAHRIALLRLRRIGALIGMRDLDRATAENDEVLDAAIADGDREIEAGSRRARGLISQTGGDLATARIRLGEAIDLYRELDDRPQLAETLRLRGFLELFGGSLSVAEWLFGEAASLYEALGDRRGLGYIDQHVGWMEFLTGRHDQAEAHLSASIAALGELGDRAGVGWAMGLMAFVK
ncbi:MAG TPA: hypothetical protein PLV68_18680, partial [Ilumatobacteraceae bacterium]|nr:hypothetical protein [Ilumatobacteraceae bacterium]